MWETIKKWGLWIVGAAIFILSIVGALAGRGKENPVADAGTTNEEATKQAVKEQNENAVEIKEKQDEVVATVTKPVVVPASQNVDEAIKRFNDA